MTLLVAAVDEHAIWMVADTAISGGEIQVRQRVNQLKIEAAVDGAALIGFAGDQFNGSRIIREASKRTSGPETAEFLLREHLKSPSVSLAYAYFDSGGPHLELIENGLVRDVPTLHLGEKSAFERFQKIRHDEEIDYAPKALKLFLFAVEELNFVPSALPTAASALLRLMAERQERDVGGWVLPYILTAERAALCTYAYSVSDPIFDSLSYGSIVPHGTAESGGFSLSVSDLGDGQGVIVYWLQPKRGVIYRKNATGYDLLEFMGGPSEFKQAASSALGRAIHVWMGDQPAGFPDRISIMTDDEGNPSTAIAHHGDSFSIVALNVATPFRTKGNIKLDNRESSNKAIDKESSKFEVRISEDKKSVTIISQSEIDGGKEINLKADDLPDLISQVGVLRSSVIDDVPAEPDRTPGKEIRVYIDPAWRTEMSPVESVPGILLKLRHPEFGWLTFLLPPHEAKNLGMWLSQNSGVASDPISGAS